MSGPRLHWFWQAIIAVAYGCEGFVALIALTVLWVGATGYVGSRTFGVVYLCLAVILPTIFYTAVVAVIRTRREFDNETRCRKCGYILRGITEPRCPECGEPI
jgi:uncharacterized membrane protein (DUF485 family)